MKKIFLVTGILGAIFIFVVLLFLDFSHFQKKETEVFLEGVGDSVFANDILGIKFSYPKVLGVAYVRDGQMGETGEKIEIRFTNNENFIIGGITEDFSAGRGGIFTDTRGYVQRGEKHYFKFVSNKEEREIVPKRIIESKAGNILLLDDKSFEAERLGVSGPVLGVGRGNIGAVMNLQNSTFSGIAFWNLDVTSFTEKSFEKLLKSVTFTGEIPIIREESDLQKLMFIKNGQEWTSFVSYNFGFSFAYRVEPDGYALFIPEEPYSVKTFILTKKSDLDNMKPQDVVYKEPPVLTIDIFENSGNLTARNWAEKYALQSQYINTYYPIETAEINGVEGVRLQWEGLYGSESVIMKNGGYIFNITYSYADTSAERKKDFEEFIQTFEFLH